MKPSKIGMSAIVLLMVGPTQVFGVDCKGLKDLNIGLSGPIQQLVSAVKGDSKARADCGSLASVLDRVVNTRKRGGRKLEDERPLDPNEAQANLAQAQSDPAVRRRLEQIRKDISDEPQRLLYEAATLDEEGYYSARDMRIRELQQRLR